MFVETDSVEKIEQPVGVSCDSTVTVVAVLSALFGIFIGYVLRGNL